MARFGNAGPAAVSFLLVLVVGCSPDSGEQNAGHDPGDSGTVTPDDNGGGNGQTGGNGQAAGNGAVGPCAAPMDPSRSALCLSIGSPNMQFEQDPQLDGRGQLVIQVFDSPRPEAEGRVPLDVRVYPDQPAVDSGVPLNEAPITELPVFRFEGLPETVFIRAQFYDNELALGGGLFWGLWTGGTDLSEPFAKNPDTGTFELDLALTPIELPAGEGTAATLELVPLRRLELEVSLAADLVPLDDGDGPLVAASYRQPTSDSMPTGVGTDCVSVTEGAATIFMTVLGTGPHYLWASLNDFNTGGNPAPGVLENAVTRQGGVVTLPEASAVEFSPDQYRLQAPLQLSQVEPTDPDNEPAPFSCP